MKIHVCVSVVFVTLTLGQLTNGDIDQRMADLEHLVLTLVRERDQSNSRLQEVESSTRQQLVSLDRKLVSVKSELSDLQYKYDNLIVQKTDVLQTSVPKSVRATSNTAQFAFNAKLGSRHTQYGRDETIILDSVLTNDGHGYDPRTAAFTCHVAGTYVFLATITVERGFRFGAEIVKSGKEIAWLLAEPAVARASASTSVVVNLVFGDIVLLRSDGVFDQSNATLDDQFTSFSGYMIESGKWVPLPSTGG